MAIQKTTAVTSPLQIRRITALSAGMILAFLVLPILVVFPLSFSGGTLLAYPVEGLSLRWYKDFFTNPLWTNAAKNSLLLAVCVTVLATALGTSAALGLRLLPSRLRRAVMALLITPLIVPLIIIAVASFFFFSKLGIAGSFIGLVLAHTSLALPFVVITVTASLHQLDENLLRASAVSGAAPVTTFRRITLPLIRPGVLAGMLFAFVTSFDEVVVAIFLGSPQLRTLPRQLWSGVRESTSPTVTAAAVVLVLISVLLTIVVEIIRRRGALMHQYPQQEKA